jgi:hypothetical protein
MIQNGLLKEVFDFHEKVRSSPSLFSDDPSDAASFSDETSSGVMIAIGYKELLPYIFEVERQRQESHHTSSNPTEPNQNTVKLDQLLKSCIERVCRAHSEPLLD